tara:strand:- start:1492 stop:1686 length:195 start_codon:yes stop_codon:yes gene_type:complete
MKFKNFIKNKGKTTVAQELGCSIHTVRSWYYGNRQPTIKQAKRIMLLSGEELSWEDLYGNKIND